MPALRLLRVTFFSAVLSLAIAALVGCDTRSPEMEPEGGLTASPARPAQDRSAGAFADTDPWVLKTADPDAARGNHGIFLGNGFLGATFGASGGAGKEGRAFCAGTYDQRETLLPLPNWHQLNLPAPKAGQPYLQTLDMREGVLVTQSGDTTVSAFLSAANPYLAVIHIENGGGGLPSAADTTAQPTMPPTLSYRQELLGDDRQRTLFVQIAPTRSAQASAANWHLSYPEERERHKAVWARRWQQADITIEGDAEAQQLVHKLLFDLMQSAYPGSPHSIAPETLAGEFYKGHIFWDAEVWMFPALVALHPQLARPMLDYRFTYLPQAREQAKQQGYRGADFPWESAASGKETAPGGFSQGRHVTAGVGWAAWHYWLATGDREWLKERGWPLLSGAADYFASAAKKNPQTGKYDLKNITGPDEFALGITNNTYTNAMARNVLLYAAEAAKLLGQKADPTWKTVAENLALPFDKAKNRYLKMEGDQGKPGVKQADGELILYPAELPMNPETAAATFDFHKARVIKNGPAMTYSIHSLIAARLGRGGEAEQALRESYRPFIRGPFLLFSEKRSLDRCVFTTGAGGVLQSVVYGFGGLTYHEPDGLVDTAPALPESWTRLEINGISRLGKRYKLVVTPEGRKLEPAES